MHNGLGIQSDYIFLYNLVEPFYFLHAIIFSDYERLADEQKETLGQYVVILHSYWGLGRLPLQVPDIRAVLELCAKVGI